MEKTFSSKIPNLINNNCSFIADTSSLQSKYDPYLTIRPVIVQWRFKNEAWYEDIFYLCLQYSSVSPRTVDDRMGISNLPFRWVSINTVLGCIILSFLTYEKEMPILDFWHSRHQMCIVVIFNCYLLSAISQKGDDLEFSIEVQDNLLIIAYFSSHKNLVPSARGTFLSLWA